MTRQPDITVGIMDRRTEVTGRLDGDFFTEGFGPLSGRFSAKVMGEEIVLTDASREICRSSLIRLTASKGSPLRQAFTLFHVTIGNRFHWEEKKIRPSTAASSSGPLGMERWLRSMKYPWRITWRA